MASFILSVFATLFLCLISILAAFVIRCRWHPQSLNSRRKQQSVAFFHPYCMAGGGGERVLWAALKSLLTRYPNLSFIIYTGDPPEKCAEFREHVADRFKIDISPSISANVQFIHLQSRTLLEARHYPFLTMIGQSLGSIIVGLEAMWKFCPDIFVDTTGCAFTFPVFKLLASSQIAAYVHYPTISTDMLTRVRSRSPAYNHASLIARLPWLTSLKVVYYQLFAWLYGWCGHCCNLTMVNSTWTLNHIKQIWKSEFAIIVYPPCNVLEFLSLGRKVADDDVMISIVSIGQFRPEKDHRLQIRMLPVLLDLLPEEMRGRIRMDFVGSCRNAEDENRVEELRKLAEKLNVGKFVKFHLNAPFAELLEVCRNGTINLHTMWNEHFGIGVVEGMAAGLLTVAHNSGGPKMDIVTNWDEGRTGYLAETEKEYATAIKNLLLLNSHEQNSIRKRARLSVQRFSDENFDEKFSSCMKALLRSNTKLKN